MLVRELMTSDPVTVTQDTPVKVALALLARHRITSMPVLGTTGPACAASSARPT